jgi:ribonuclease HI
MSSKREAATLVAASSFTLQLTPRTMIEQPDNRRGFVPHSTRCGAQMKLELIFDGGSLGNPGRGYGSFRLTVDGQHVPVQELEFGDSVTNNQAEYRTMIEGLKYAIALLHENGRHPANAEIDVLTDSKLVVEQVNGRWKVKHEGLKPLQREAKALLDQFMRGGLTWHPRKESVKVLGH